MDYVFIFNVFEAGLWFTLGVVLLFAATRKTAWRGRFVLSAIGFIAFGFTDVVETQTGAWWRPWWLFVWKAACVILLIAVGVYHYRSGKADRD